MISLQWHTYPVELTVCTYNVCVYTVHDLAIIKPIGMVALCQMYCCIPRWFTSGRDRSNKGEKQVISQTFWLLETVFVWAAAVELCLHRPVIPHCYHRLRRSSQPPGGQSVEFHDGTTPPAHSHSCWWPSDRDTRDGKLTTVPATLG